MDRPQPDLGASEPVWRTGTDSHEMRTPLTVIVGRVQLLRRRVRRGELDGVRIEADLEAIEAALARLMATLLRSDRDC